MENTNSLNSSENDYIEKLRQKMIDNITEEEEQELEECAIKQEEKERAKYLKEAREKRRNQFLYDFSGDDSSLNLDFW